MSNTLSNFIQHEKKCPLCHSELSLSFIFRSKDTIKYEDNYLTAKVNIGGYPYKKLNTQFSVKFYFDLSNDSFHVDFFNKNGIRYTNFAWLSFIEDYKKCIQNKGDSIRFYNECLKCKKYGYSSSGAHLNYKTAALENITLSAEHFCFNKVLSNNNVYCYKILNNYENSKSILQFGETELYKFKSMKQINITENLEGYLELPIIQLDFSNYSEVIKKLDTLICFY